MAPKSIIILLFLATFILCAFQYYRIDPEWRLLNVRAGLMITSIMGASGYPIYDYLHPGDRWMSWLLFALAIVWIVTSYYLLRRIPPRETD
ncbi:MAG TPA: hypothetical protein VGG99_01255 [Acetobacteraceae bacterium]|jgi:hypothetical protein